MKFLLVPENNSLSHIAKCLALEAALTARGHEVLVAVSRKNAVFVRSVGGGISCCVLPDIQENDEAGLPTVEWFRRPQRIIDCMKAENALLREFRPDRVLGVFRFTLKASAQLAGIPYDSLTCGCMLPDSPEVLGFAPGEPGAGLQRQYLELFYRYAGAKVSVALTALGLDPVDDIRMMLLGERTFLWDFPEFVPSAPQSGVRHIGPITWNGWPHDAIDIGTLTSRVQPLAIVAFGTCKARPAVADRIIRLLCRLGYQVVLAAGGQDELLQVTEARPLVTACRFAPLHQLLPQAALLVCHGGQMTMFEALARQIPVLVMPFQPEQAHNGVCIERLGCGKRLIAPQPFLGNPGVYIEAFNATTDEQLAAIITGLTENADTSRNLAIAHRLLAQYDGIETLTTQLEAGCQ